MLGAVGQFQYDPFPRVHASNNAMDLLMPDGMTFVVNVSDSDEDTFAQHSLGFIFGVGVVLG